MIILIIVSLIILLSLTAYFLYTYFTASKSCDTKYAALQITYDNDTKPLTFQTRDLKEKVFELQNKADELSNENASYKERLRLLEKNITGKFDHSGLVGQAAGSCVSIANVTKGDYTLLTLEKQCKTHESPNLFSYDPVQKQLIVKHGEKNRCIDAVNETDVVLNDCIKTSQKQKFNYFPLDGGRFKSVLYSKCLGYNNDTGIIEIQKCLDATNIQTKRDEQYGHLYLENE